ncbi:MAG: ComF family protein [Bacteroidetes bacterium]|nr:ComF family protein [Bacteroidales bacterium]MBU1010358.1 ComF family protein [Bacteroidota bacterium]
MRLRFITDLVSLFYPEVCAACGHLLFAHEKTVCLSCRHLLADTGYEGVQDNPVARMYWGRCRFEAACGIYFFSKKGKVQHLIHELKYKGNREAGLFLGTEMGKKMAASALYQSVDVVVPVPLHPKKIHKRGFNQSEIIAHGIQEITSWPVSTDNLIRSVATATQTKKSRTARWENVKDIFLLQRPGDLAGKHVLLVDDVITTGSTIEACAIALSAAPGIKISVAAAACAPG